MAVRPGRTSTSSLGRFAPRHSCSTATGRWWRRSTTSSGLRHQSEPFEVGGRGGGTGTYWTTFSYDPLGRLTSTTRPDSSVSTASYDGLLTTLTDALGHTRVETKNAVGDLVLVEDDLNGQVAYTYDHEGNLDTTIQSGPGVSAGAIDVDHDLLGRKQSMSEPDMGDWSYQYNAFGELILQTNAKGETTEIRYDLMGRMVRRIDYETGGAEESDSAWVYDTAPNGLGQLHMEDTMVGTSTTPIRRTYAYDQFGRGRKVTTEITRGANTETYVERTTYDEHGRLFQEFDASGGLAGLEYTYNGNGYVSAVVEAKTSGAPSGGQAYYSVLAMDARGNVTQMQKGGLTVNRQFDQETGTPTQIRADDPSAMDVQKLQLDFDELGNLVSRIDQSKIAGGGYSYKDIQETYGYDNLNRLDWVRQDGTLTLDLDYDPLGNITFKRSYRPDV